ncbi:SDR family oxidoreductase [bacterium]|nr:SDR family oxidoreductase [bacterium]
MKVLVTGPSGFVGRKVCQRLLADEINVRGAWRKTSPLADGCESDVVGDINGTTDWSNALTGIDAVVHLAARVHVMDDTAADPMAAFREVNVDGTVRLAEEAAKAGVKRFLFISSIKVNGEATLQSSDRRSEDGSQTSEVRSKRRRTENQELSTENSSAAFCERDQPDPQDPYGQSKYEAEVALRKIEASTGMEVVVLRPPLLYGPGVKANFLKLIQLVDKGIPFPFGGIKNKRSLLSLTNFSDIISKCVTDPRAGGQTFTVCDGDDVSSGELVERLAKALGKAPRLVPVPEWLMKLAGKLTGKSAQVQRLCNSLQVDLSHARKILDWKPPLTMDEELGEVAKWYKSL